MIIALIYVRRMIRRSDGQLVLLRDNWKGVILACIVLSNKVWDDFHMRNLDYCRVFKGLTVDRVNTLERSFLITIDCACNVSPSVYARTHFEIQDMIALLKIEQGKSREKMKNRRFSFTRAKVHPGQLDFRTIEQSIAPLENSPMPLSPYSRCSEISHSSRLPFDGANSLSPTENFPITPQLSVVDWNNVSNETINGNESVKHSDQYRNPLQGIICNVIDAFQAMGCKNIATADVSTVDCEVVDGECSWRQSHRHSRKAFAGRTKGPRVLLRVISWFGKDEEI